MLEMILVILVIVGLAAAGMLVALMTKKITLAQVEAELVKLESEATVVEQTVVAKVKAILAKL